jgi:hypothetical protein
MSTIDGQASSAEKKIDILAENINTAYDFIDIIKMENLGGSVSFI